MKIHEFQAKALFSKYGIPAPKGQVVDDARQAAAFAGEIGCPVMVKVQIHAGGRGKAGGVERADTAEEAQRAASRFLGLRFVTGQTGPRGRIVSRVLVEEALAAKREMYLSITIDRKEACAVIAAGSAGGTEVETALQGKVKGLFTEKVDPVVGLRPFQALRMGFPLGLEPAMVKQLRDIASSLYRLFIENDCSLAEINPLAVCESHLVALDGKITLDDNALFRHPDLVALRDSSQDDPLEAEAAKLGLNYIKLEGNVGCMVNGAGLAMATMDLIKLYGAEPANFLDVGGGATRGMIKEGMRILLADRDVKVIFVNIFGGILRCDVLAEGLAAASRELSVSVPVVVRMEGTNVEKGRSILSQSGLSFISFETMEEAAGHLTRLLCSNG